MNNSEKPDIILLLADDMGYSDLGCFGAEIHTPNLDRMAQEGIRYTQMYNNARCCPSRASLLTGLYPHQAGVGHMTGDLGLPEYQGYLNGNCVTLAEGLRQVGYQTAMAGKWHVGGEYGHSSEACQMAGSASYPTPMQRGFERFYGTLEGAGNYYHPVTLMEDGVWLPIKPEEDFYYTEAIGQKACEYIDSFTQTDQPYFLYTSFSAPHWPLHARDKDIRDYEGKYRKGWDDVRRCRYERQVQMGIVRDIWDISQRDDEALPWEEAAEPEWEDLKMAVYAAQVQALDREVGRIRECVEANGRLENTVFLFLSDNGACAEILPEKGWIMNFAESRTLDGRPVSVGNSCRKRPGGEDTYISYGLSWANASNTPFRLFKHWIHEGGISTPFIMKWDAGIAEKGGIRHMPVHFIDIFPTLLELAGAEYPRELLGTKRIPLPGESLLESLYSDWQRKTPIFWEHEGNCGVRLGRYKLVRRYPEAFELYDMESDRTELHNLAASQPEILNELKQKYVQWMRQTKVRDWEEISGSW